MTDHADRHATGVWISAASASVLRWSAAAATPLHIDSEVPGRHRSTGRPPTAHRPAGEGHLDAHMLAFFDEVAEALLPGDDILMLGDGEVVGHFADRIRADDASHDRKRRVEVDKSGPLTERQLLARTRAFAGAPAKRQLVR